MSLSTEELAVLNMRKPLKNKRDVPPIANPWKLSPMEYAVLMRYALGMSTKEVADSLCLSEKTVATYSTRAREKMSHFIAGSERGDIITLTRACVLVDRFQREGAVPAFKLLVECEDGKVTTRVMQ